MHWYYNMTPNMRFCGVKNINEYYYIDGSTADIANEVFTVSFWCFYLHNDNKWLRFVKNIMTRRAYLSYIYVLRVRLRYARKTKVLYQTREKRTPSMGKKMKRVNIVQYFTKRRRQFGRRKNIGWPLCSRNERLVRQRRKTRELFT